LVVVQGDVQSTRASRLISTDKTNFVTGELQKNEMSWLRH
jgi:hypothetical protein